MLKIKMAPSVLACDMLHLEDEIRRADEAGADMIHCDVMDGIYVPNISFGFDVIAGIGRVTELPLDVHMMTVAPEKYLDRLAAIGADMVTIHHDSRDRHPELTMREIRERGMKCGLAISPKIPAETVFPYLELADMILVMSVEPGFGGQKFHPEAADKIRVIREELNRRGLETPIEVDGGINAETAAVVRAAGADVLVAGTSSFRAPDMKAALTAMRGE